MNQFNSDEEIYHCLRDALKLPPEGDHREEDAVLNCIIALHSRSPNGIEGVRARRHFGEEGPAHGRRERAASAHRVRVRERASRRRG